MDDHCRVDCQHCKVPRLFYRFLDHDLSTSELEDLKQYLSERQSCCHHLEFEKLLRDWLKKNLTPAQIPSDLKRKLLDQLAKESCDKKDC